MAKINILFIVVKFNLNLFKNQKANKKNMVVVLKNKLISFCLFGLCKQTCGSSHVKFALSRRETKIFRNFRICPFNNSFIRGRD